MRPLRARLFGLYKVSIPVAALLATPLLVLIGWYVWAAWAELDRYRRAVSDAPSIDVETFHVALYDELYREYLALHDYFGRGGSDVMIRLRRLHRTAMAGAAARDGSLSGTLAG